MHFIRSKTILAAGYLTVTSVFQGPSFSLRMSEASPTNGPFSGRRPPLNVEPFLNYLNYQPRGCNMKLKDHTEFYASGTTSGKHAIIIIPDSWGWTNGRIRNICDFFGDQDCFAVIPNFRSKGIEGDHQSYFESHGIMDWYKSRSFDGNIKPVIVSILQFMKNEGIEHVSLLGFGWGAWVAVNLLASEYAEEFECAALASPSIDLEETMYGGSVPDLLSRVNRPLLLLPTKGDTSSYTAYMKLLKYKLPTSKVIDYHDTEAGFLLRGNSDLQHIRRAIEKSLNEIYSFFDDHKRMDPNQLVRHVEELGEEARIKPDRSWSQYFKETGDQTKDSAQKTGERVGEKVKESGEHIGERMKEAGKSVGKSVEDTGKGIQDRSQSTGDRWKEYSRGDRSPKNPKDR